MDQSRGDYEGIWQKLSQIAVQGAEYDSRERQPHPKCLEGTRVDLLNHIYGLSDNREKSQLIWLHGTAGVGKSAVAFTVAERMRGLEVTEGSKERRLAGTFFFSRKHTKRCMTGYFFATLAYQLATNFPSVRKDVNTAILENPALLDPDKSLRLQMEALFLRPLRKLRFRLRECPPLAFAVDALDECTSESELADLISLLGEALRQPDLPVTHILLTSRSESHISKAMQKEELRPLVCEIPVKTSGEGVATIISLDGADVDNDIYIFLQHSFRELQGRHSNFPQPTKDQLARLASRAGRRFIVASTMMKFIDDGYSDPRTRLQLMLELTSKLLPGTEVYKLYDLILSTCADPERAYLHLSVVAALADPLPITQISELLGPGQGRDVETTLVQLRSVMDIPTDSTLPVTIYHLSIRDYVSKPSNCSLPEVQQMTPPHSLLAHASLRLIMQDIPENTALLDALSELKRQSRAMQRHQSTDLKRSLAFIVQPLEPLQVLIALLWLQGDRSSNLQPWLSTEDGHAWLQTQEGKHWLRSPGGKDWQMIESGRDLMWNLSTPAGNSTPLESLDARDDLQNLSFPSTHSIQLDPFDIRDCLGSLSFPAANKQRQSSLDSLDIYRRWKHQSRLEGLMTPTGRGWLQTPTGQRWLQTRDGREWLQTPSGGEWLQTQGGPEWLQALSRQQWLKTPTGSEWLQAPSGQQWLKTPTGQEWLQAPSGQQWLKTPIGQEWLQIPTGQRWLLTPNGGEWLLTPNGGKWLQTESGRRWLTQGGREWLQTLNGREWLQAPGARQWLRTEGGGEWLQTQSGREWLLTQGWGEWLLTSSGGEWLQTPDGRVWLQTEGGGEWLPTSSGEEWLQTPDGRVWLQTEGGLQWLQAPGAQQWLQTKDGGEWLQTQSGRGWLLTHGGGEWLLTSSGREWLLTPNGVERLLTPNGVERLLTQGGPEWLQVPSGLQWLQTEGGREWLQTQSGREWLQTPHGQAWQSTPAASVWVTMGEFSSTLEAVNRFKIVRKLRSQPAFQAIQQFKSLPDFLMFPAFLAFRNLPDHLTQYCFPPDMEIFHAMKAFSSVANGVRVRSLSASDALKYACQNWALHLSRVANPWDDTLNQIFTAFWNNHLLSWLERQWCLKGLRSCLVLYEGQKLAKEHHSLESPELSILRKIASCLCIAR